MKQILLAIILFLSMFELNAQGCSDAGGCSVGSMSFLESLHKTKINVSFEQTFGLGEMFTLIGQSTVIVQYRFLKQLNWNFALHLFLSLVILDQLPV